MSVSKANQRAVNKYKKNNYDRIEITVPKGQRNVFQIHASARGESVNGFITRAIKETIERDTSSEPPQSIVYAENASSVPLPCDTIKNAQNAASAAGETVPEFISRAVEVQAERDLRGRYLDKLNKNEPPKGV